MPSNTLPFDNLTIGGSPLAATAMIAGTGEYKYSGQDNKTTTADGKVYHDRQALNEEAKCEARGDQTAFSTPVGLGVAVVIKRSSTTVATLAGCIVTVRYNPDTKRSTIDIKADPRLS